MTAFLRHCVPDILYGKRLSPAWCKRIAEMGVSSVRYPAQWPDISIHGTNGTAFDWAQTDDNLGMLHDAGLGVHFNLNSLPPYAAQGSSCYMEGIHGCLEFDNWGDRTGLMFNPARPGCSDPPDPDPNAIFNIAKLIATRYPDCASYSFGNEPDDRVSSAAIAHTIDLRNKGNWTATAEWVTEKFLVPFCRGIISVRPQATISGPECSTPGFMSAMLRWKGLPAWDSVDATTIHLYAGDGSFPHDAYAQLDKPGGWWAYLDELRAIGINIPSLVVGECGIEHGENPDGWLMLLPALYARGDIQAVTMLGDWWFTPESVRTGTWEPSPLYGKMQQMVSRITSRHRAVRTA